MNQGWSSADKASSSFHVKIGDQKERTMDKIENKTSPIDKPNRLLSDSELNEVTGGIIIIGGAEIRGFTIDGSRYFGDGSV